MRRLAATVFVASLGLSAAFAATSNAGSDAPRELSASLFVRSCGTDVWGDLGPVRRWQRQSIVVGPFALVWIRRARTATTASIRRAYRAGQGAFKILAVVERGHEATVTVPLGERGHVALLYDPSAFNRAQTVANGRAGGHLPRLPAVGRSATAGLVGCDAVQRRDHRRLPALREAHDPRWPAGAGTEDCGPLRSCLLSVEPRLASRSRPGSRGDFSRVGSRNLRWWRRGFRNSGWSSLRSSRPPSRLLPAAAESTRPPTRDTTSAWPGRRAAASIPGRAPRCAAAWRSFCAGRLCTAFG